jgi:hypothetical protein
MSNLKIKINDFEFNLISKSVPSIEMNYKKVELTSINIKTQELTHFFAYISQSGSIWRLCSGPKLKSIEKYDNYIQATILDMRLQSFIFSNYDILASDATQPVNLFTNNTGEIQIGSTDCMTTVRGNMRIGPSGQDGYININSTGSRAHICDEITTGTIVLGDGQTTGTLYLGTGSATRTGSVQLGTSTCDVISRGRLISRIGCVLEGATQYIDTNTASSTIDLFKSQTSGALNIGTGLRTSTGFINIGGIDSTTNMFGILKGTKTGIISGGNGVFNFAFASLDLRLVLCNYTIVIIATGALTQTLTLPLVLISGNQRVYIRTCKTGGSLNVNTSTGSMLFKGGTAAIPVTTRNLGTNTGFNIVCDGADWYEI